MPVRKSFKKLWNSPTFTTWGNYLVQSMRLILVTPLILTRFDEVEIAAWYLFASLNFFGAVLSQRLGLTFSRMFSFAMAGASDLSPVKDKKEVREDGEPDWKAMERTYGTLAVVQCCLGWLNVVLAVGMGWYGLNNILEGYGDSKTIWWAFGILQFSSLLMFVFQRYAILLDGMNYVALANRWSAVFGVISCLVGIVTLSLGGGIIELAIAMQSFILLGIFRDRYLARQVESGRMKSFRALRFDREVFGWSFEPVWKGLLMGISISGVLQFSGVLLTEVLPVVQLASYLLTMRMMQIVLQFSSAPLNSITPRLSRKLVTDGGGAIWPIVKKRATIVLMMIVSGGLAISFLANPILDMIDSTVRFLPTSLCLMLLGFLILEKYHRLCIQVGLLANRVIAFKRRVVGGVIALGGCLIGASYGLGWVLAGIFIPYQFTFGTATTRGASSVLKVSGRDFGKGIGLWYYLSAAMCFIGAIIANLYS